MLESLKEAAIAAGHPEWGHGGPHDSGNYNSKSSETGFFRSYGGSWDSGAPPPRWEPAPRRTPCCPSCAAVACLGCRHCAAAAYPPAS